MQSVVCMDVIMKTQSWKKRKWQIIMKSARKMEAMERCTFNLLTGFQLYFFPFCGIFVARIPTIYR